MRGSGIVAGDAVALPLAQAVGDVEAEAAAQGAVEAEGGGAALDELVADVVAGEDLLVGARLDLVVDEGVPGRGPGGLVAVLGAERLGDARPVREGVVDVPRLQVGAVGLREVLAPRHRHRAQPVLVRRPAVVARLHQRVPVLRRRLALHLLQRLLEVAVHLPRVVVVEPLEVRHLGEELRVGRHGVLRLVAQCQVENHSACAHYVSRSKVSPSLSSR